MSSSIHFTNETRCSNPTSCEIFPEEFSICLEGIEESSIPRLISSENETGEITPTLSHVGEELHGKHQEQQYVYNQINTHETESTFRESFPESPTEKFCRGNKLPEREHKRTRRRRSKRCKCGCCCTHNSEDHKSCIEHSKCLQTRYNKNHGQIKSYNENLYEFDSVCYDLYDSIRQINAPLYRELYENWYSTYLSFLSGSWEGNKDRTQCYPPSNKQRSTSTQRWAENGNSESFKKDYSKHSSAMSNDDSRYYFYYYDAFYYGFYDTMRKVNPVMYASLYARWCASHRYFYNNSLKQPLVTSSDSKLYYDKRHDEKQDGIYCLHNPKSDREISSGFLNSANTKDEERGEQESNNVLPVSTTIQFESITNNSFNRNVLEMHSSTPNQSPRVENKINLRSPTDVTLHEDDNSREPKIEVTSDQTKPVGLVDNQNRLPLKKSKTSWMNTLWKKFLPLTKDAAHLPDDTNPTIVWDSTRNEWVDLSTSGHEQACSLPLPPKSVTYSGTQENIYRLRKSRGSHSRYVDVLQSCKKTSDAFHKNLKDTDNEINFSVEGCSISSDLQLQKSFC